MKNRPLKDKLIVFGEVGLAGEIRPVQRGQDRLREASKLGFGTAIVPRANDPRGKVAGIDIVPVARVDEMLGSLWS